MKKILFMAALLLTFCACNNSDSKTVPPKKGSSGKTLELMVVANKDVYVGETKEFIDSMFGSPQPCLIVPESKFDIVNIPKTSFENTEMFHNYRNVLLLDINPDNPNKVYLHIDEYAAPQVVVDFATKDHASLRELLKKYESKILEEFYKAEHRRIYKAFKGIEGYDLNKAIRDQFGFGLMFSNEFIIAKKDKNFAWVRKEAKDFGIGVWIEVIPYKSQEDFEEERILDRLDTMLKHYVPATAEESYAGIERRRTDKGEYLAPIMSRMVTFDSSSYSVETRGSWRTFGDFMGGPFVSYSVLSPDKKNIISLTGYVYCPRNKPWTKRDLLMQVEGICWSLSFDDGK